MDFAGASLVPPKAGTHLLEGASTSQNNSNFADFIPLKIFFFFLERTYKQRYRLMNIPFRFCLIN